jgi:hypothetical protein
LLGVIAFKLGRKLTWDAQQEQFPGGAERLGWRQTK